MIARVRAAGRRVLAAVPGLRPAWERVRPEAVATYHGLQAVRAVWQDAGWQVAWSSADGAGLHVDRVNTLRRALDLPSGGADTALATAIARSGAPGVWLTMAVLDAVLPTSDDVVSEHRRLRRAGAEAWLAERSLASHRRLTRPGPRPPVVQVVGGTLVDVHHTALTDLSTGIQRVSRQLAAHAAARAGVSLVGWTRSYRAMRLLSAAEAARATGLPASASGVPVASSRRPVVIVPWRCTVVLPELAVELPRTARMQAIATYSATRSGVIGFDCVPLSSPETVTGEMSANFSRALAAVRHVDRVVAISESAAEEYRGWRDSVRATGRRGPDIVTVELPRHPPAATVPGPAGAPVDPHAVRAGLAPGPGPLVLVVGSHEPRKNHMAVLHAAERLWRSGLAFTLLFVGGNSWLSEGFTARVDALRAAGRPLHTATAVDDDHLVAVYRAAHCLVFPSLNEGFGLPVAEALSLGVPVVTSGYGSMAALVAHGGGVTVDPRDDDSVTDGLRRVLTDAGLHARLVAEAAALPASRTWAEYCDEAWRLLTADPVAAAHP